MMKLKTKLVFGKCLLALTLLSIIFSASVFSASEDILELQLKEVSNTWTNEIELVFSNEISEMSLEQDGSLFTVEAANNYYDIYEITAKKLDEEDKHIMKLVLDKDFTIGEEYRVIVLTIEDIYGQNIVSGVDSEAFFIAKEILPKPPSLPSIEEPTLPSGQDIEPINSTLGDGSNIGGVTLNSGTITSKIDKVAEGSSKLPTAGSEHILLLILALLLASGFVIYTYKKA